MTGAGRRWRRIGVVIAVLLVAGIVLRLALRILWG
jgi:hypothetical protein